MYTVYEIRDLETGKSYIGCTKYAAQKRFNQHVSHRNDLSNPLSLALMDLDKETICRRFELRAVCSIEDRREAFETEKMVIDMADTIHPNGYNGRVGGTYTAAEWRPIRRRLFPGALTLKDTIAGMKQGDWMLVCRPSNETVRVTAYRVRKLYPDRVYETSKAQGGTDVWRRK